MRRKKFGEKMMGSGAGAILLFGSGLDCQDNNMLLLYGGIIVGLILLYIGAKMADAWM